MLKAELSAEELDDDFKCAISAGDIGKLTLSGADPEIVEVESIDIVFDAS